jgi:hypothetical protein
MEPGGYPERGPPSHNGARKNIEDPSIFPKIALFPFLAWVGFGADGVSSSSL